MKPSKIIRTRSLLDRGDLCKEQYRKCPMFSGYISRFPEKAYGGAIIRDFDMNLCKESASGEVIDFLLHQGMIERTGARGTA